MMDNLFRCWSFCLKCCLCCCRCGRGARNRVGPAKASTVVTTTSAPTKRSHFWCCCFRRKANTPPVRLLNNGETNLYYQSDEVTVGGREQEFSQIPETNRNGRCSESPEEIAENEDSASSSVPPSTTTTENFVHEEFLSMLYVETGPGKQLHVVRVIPNPAATQLKDKGETSSSVGQHSASLGGNSVETTATAIIDSEEDSEDEYWFSRWSRRPRLKNSFKGTIGKDDTTQNTCIESRIAKEIEKFQIRNYHAKTNGSVADRESGEVSISPSTRNSSVSYSVDSNSANVAGSVFETIPTSTTRNGNGSATNSFTNYGFQPEETVAATTTMETKTETETISDIAGGDSPESPPPVVPNVLNSDSGPTGEMLQKPKSQPLLFFIHGISGSSDVWKPQFEFFHSAGFEIVAPDLLGHGLSSTPNKTQYYLFESLVQDLVHVFDHFVREDRQGVLIGHGYGACLATVLSRVRPKNVCLLVSISGGGPSAMAPPASYRPPLLPFNLNLFAKKGISARFDNPDLHHVLPNYIHRKILRGQVWVDGDTAFHRRVSVPTLLIYGMRDKVVSLIEECEMERTIPRAFLELIPTAGHMVMWDEPKKLNKMILKFIQSWPCPK